MNHLAPGIERVGEHLVVAPDWTSKNSQIEPQNASRSSVDQRHSAA